MRNIEEQLWNYMDGTCAPQEREVIEHLIATDEIYQQKYEEIKALDLELQDIELDAPSMAFTYNVMEDIRTEEAAKPLKATIDNRIIKGIFAFFIVSILAILIIALADTNWSAGTANGFKVPDVRLPEFKNYFNGPVFKGFLFFDAVGLLYFLDNYLRKRKIHQQAH